MADFPDDFNTDFTIPEDACALTLPPPPPNRWPPQLVFDLALGLDGYEAIEARYSLTREQLDRLYALPLFRQEVALLKRELANNNSIFKHKAKIQAESYLTEMDALMQEPSTPASTKLEIFKTMAKYGDLEPKEAKSEKDAAAQVVIRIESNVRDPLIDITPRTVEAARAS